MLTAACCWSGILSGTIDSATELIVFTEGWHWPNVLVPPSFVRSVEWSNTGRRLAGQRNLPCWKAPCFNQNIIPYNPYTVKYYLRNKLSPISLVTLTEVR